MNTAGRLHLDTAKDNMLSRWDVRVLVVSGGSEEILMDIVTK